VRVASTDDGHVISATLDDVTERMTSSSAAVERHDESRLRLPASVYFGGMDVSASTFGRHSATHLLTYLLGI